MTLAALGLGLLGLLITARVLVPDARGWGTHKQLGLPDCTFVTVFGSRCPSCGMTTSWAHLTRGQLGDALRANPGGTLLGLLAALAAPWAMVSSVRGRWLWGKPSERALVVVCGLIVVVTLINWLLRLPWGAS